MKQVIYILLLGGLLSFSTTYSATVPCPTYSKGQYSLGGNIDGWTIWIPSEQSTIQLNGMRLAVKVGPGQLLTCQVSKAPKAYLKIMTRHHSCKIDPSDNSAFTCLE